MKVVQEMQGEEDEEKRYEESEREKTLSPRTKRRGRKYEAVNKTYDEEGGESIPSSTDASDVDTPNTEEVESNKSGDEDFWNSRIEATEEHRGRRSSTL